MFYMSDIFRKRKKCKKVHNPEPRQLDQLYIYTHTHIYNESESVSHSVLSDSLWPHGL